MLILLPKLPKLDKQNSNKDKTLVIELNGKEKVTKVQKLGSCEEQIN